MQGEYKRARERILKEKKAELALLQKRKQLLGDALPQEDADNIYFLEEDIDRYGDMLDRMKDSDEVRVVLTKKDVPASKEYDGLFQVRTEESNQRKKRLKLES